MKRLSSRGTWLLKWYMPVLWLALAANAAHSWFGRLDRFGDDALVLIFITPIFLAVFFFGPWRLAREVEDRGDALVFRRHSREQRVDLADVLNVNWGQYGRNGITLWVRKPGAIGEHLTFLPVGAWQYTAWQLNPVVAELIRRVDRAKRGAAS